MSVLYVVLLHVYCVLGCVLALILVACFYRRATFVKSKAVRVKQPPEPAWPVTNTAAVKHFTSHGESQGCSSVCVLSYSDGQVSLV